MFVLKPDGDDSGGSGGSQVRKNLWFFGKLGLYFVAIRAAHLYLADSSDSNSSENAQK